MVTRKFETFRQSSSSTSPSRNWKASRSASAILLQVKLSIGSCITRESDPGSYTNDVRWTSLAWIYAIMRDELGILPLAPYTWLSPWSFSMQISYLGAPSAITTWNDLFFLASFRNSRKVTDRPSVKITSLHKPCQNLVKKSHRELQW